MAARRGVAPGALASGSDDYPPPGLITISTSAASPVGDARGLADRAGRSAGRGTIRHALTPRWPLVSGWPSQMIVGDFFVEYIAGQTLRHLRAYAESGQDELDARAHRREPSQDDDDRGDDE